MDNRPIGVFDSGIGGLTVVNALADVLPCETIYYLGDTARVPYGNKSNERIEKYSYQIVKWLIEQDCKMIVVACNTASSLALKFLKSEFSLPIIGVIQPGVMSALNTSKNYNIGVLGTQATIKSDAYGKYLNAIHPDVKTVSRACPLFVPLVEEGLVEGSIPLSIADLYLNSIKNTNVDTVILGCTHYPLLKNIIEAVLGGQIRLVDSGQATASIVVSKLNDYKLLSEKNKGEIQCFVTDSPTSFDALAGRFLHRYISKTILIDIS